MYYAGCELAVRSVQKRTQHGHQEDKSPPAKALGKGLSVPGKECHWPDDGQIEKAALNPPVNGGGRTGVVGYRFQIPVDTSYRLWSSGAGETFIVNNRSAGTKPNQAEMLRDSCGSGRLGTW